MKFNFLCCGFCLGMAVCSFIDGEIDIGIFQSLCVLANVPSMIFGGNK